MDATRFAAFETLRDGFRDDVERWARACPRLRAWQEEARKALGYEDYEVETTVVYNRDFDDVTAASDIRFVLVGDNPGKSEQLADNRRYLVGQAGKLATRVFRELLGADFRTQVLIVNKTPIHSAKTAELKKLFAIASDERLQALFVESQRRMAALACELTSLLEVPMWICGYGELGEKGIFREWSRALREKAASYPRSEAPEIWAFPHFSMNRFSIEVPPRFDKGKSVMQNLEAFGRAARVERMGW